MKVGVAAAAVCVVVLDSGAAWASAPPGGELTREQIAALEASFASAAAEDGYTVDIVACTTDAGQATCFGRSGDTIIVGSGQTFGLQAPAWMLREFVDSALLAAADEPAIVTATTTDEPMSNVGTRDAPIPFGLPVPGRQWTYTVTAFERAVDGVVMMMNPYNSPAPPDSQYVRLRVRAVYDGTGLGNPSLIRINLVDGAGTTYQALDPCCEPDVAQLTDQPETYTGGAVEGWLYYIVPNLAALGKFVAFDPDVNYTNVPGGIAFFTVN